METKKMYTADELSKILRVSRTTLSRLVKDNRIAHYRIGQRIMFEQQMLDEFKASVLQPATSHRRGHGDAEGQSK